MVSFWAKAKRIHFLPLQPDASGKSWHDELPSMWPRRLLQGNRRTCTRPPEFHVLLHCCVALLRFAVLSFCFGVAVVVFSCSCSWFFYVFLCCHCLSVLTSLQIVWTTEQAPLVSMLSWSKGYRLKIWEISSWLVLSSTNQVVESAWGFCSSL